MTQEQKLRAIIEKAIKNGFSNFPVDIVGVVNWTIDTDYYQILFSHDFAKAFWPTPDYAPGSLDDQEPWQYHLQQAVISEDPIDYYYDKL